MADAATRIAHVVVTCTSRKRLPVPPRAHMRRVTGTTLSKRMENWIERLVNAPTPAVDANDLYCGGHWDLVRRLPSMAKVPLTTWVASAGYGLIPVSAPVTPYAATFDTRHRDTVIRSGTDARSWWRLLGEWEGPIAGMPRSLAHLTASSPNSRFILVLSEPYLGACLPDVQQAISRLTRADQLSVICAGGRQFDVLDRWLIPCDARLQTALGGTRQSLNIRTATYLLSTGAVSHKAMRQRAKRLLAQQPPLHRYARQQLSDAEVRRFVREQRRDDPTLSATRALRALRDAGFACEQGRFAGLFAAETGGAA